MAQHGYLREGYGMWGDHDEGRDRERERSWDRDEDRGFMFGDRERGGFRGRDEDEWFGGRRREERPMSRYGPEHGFGGFQGDYRGGNEQGGFGGAGDYVRGRTSFSSHPDDHYRSWRQKQIDALDRDYADYCREREQQFHRDFDSWRSNRQSQAGNRGQTDELMLNRPAETLATDPANEPQSTVSPESGATLGATEPTPTGRRR